MPTKINSYSPDRIIAVDNVNRVASFNDVQDRPRIAFRGSSENLAMLENLNASAYSSNWKALTFPATRGSISFVELFCGIEDAHPTYIDMRNRIFAPAKNFRYPQTTPGKPEPLAHQIDCLAYMDEVYKSGKTGFYNMAEMGCGKTRSTVDAIRHFEFNKILIICKKIAMTQWKEEFISHNFFEDSIKILEGTIQTRSSILRHEGMTKKYYYPKIFILNWEAVDRLRDELTKYQQCPWDIIVGDEGSSIKERNSKVTESSLLLAKHSLHRLLLSGTPVGGSIADLWSQFRFLEPDLFGKSFWRFAENYGVLGGFNGKSIVELNYRNIPDLIEKVYSISHRVTKAGAFDMPQKLYRTVTLEAKDHQKRVYRHLSKELFATSEYIEKGNIKDRVVGSDFGKIKSAELLASGLEPLNDSEESLDSSLNGNPRQFAHLNVKSALSKSLRLTQITAGIFPVTDVSESENKGEAIAKALRSKNVSDTKDYIDLEDDFYSGDEDLLIETVDKFKTRKIEYMILDNPKTDYVVEFCADSAITDPTSKIIVWVRFRAELQNVVDRLKRELGDDRVGFIDGSVKQADRDLLRLAFNNRSNKLFVLVGNIQAMAYSMDLPAADTLLYHSNTFNSRDRLQSEDRGHRLGRTRPYQIIDLVLENTIDLQIQRALKAKKDLADMIMTTGFNSNWEISDNLYNSLPDPRMEVESIDLS